MYRGPTGTHDVRRLGGEDVRAFVPNPLPPKDLDLASRQLQLEAAQLAIGRLDSVSTLLPDPHLFIYTYVRKEAVLSSQIEGTQPSLSDLLLFELEEEPGAPLDDVVEVSSYVAALHHGLERLRGGFPLSARLLREVHGKLLAYGRGNDKLPGEFRRSQNWINGTRPGNAHFVPPPAEQVTECMSRLEEFLHARSDGLPALVRAGLAHVQFETIHPFLDGNGRVGRLLIALLLYDVGALTEPLLYLSLFLKTHRQEYYRLLDEVRHSGDWEAWLDFFLEGVRATAESAVETARTLVELFQTDNHRLVTLGRGLRSALAVHGEFKSRPILSIRDAAKRTDLTFPTIAKAMQQLVDLGIAREITGKSRGRLFAYDAYLAKLSEGTEPT